MGFDRRPALIAVLFSLSGCASLMDQVVWLRFLSLAFGNTTYATATLLAVFLGGLGLGALVFGRWADHLRHPLRTYAGVQVGVALFAVLSPAVFGGIDQVYVLLYRAFGNQPALFALGRVLLAVVCLLPPTLLMGGTLPLVLRGTAPSGGAPPGRRTALLYAANTLGAVAGVALAGFVTIRLMGLYNTLLLAALLDLAAGFGILLLARKVSLPTIDTLDETAVGERREDWQLLSRRSWLLLLFFLMGATSLGFEVLWTRALVFYLGSSVYAYSLMLVLFLAGVGVGGLAIWPWIHRLSSRGALFLLGWLEAGIALWVLVQIVLFGRLHEMLEAVAGLLGAEAFPGLAMAQLVATAPLLLPPTLAMGASFPLAVQALNRRAQELGFDVGQVYAGNTFGAVCGALGAGFALIPLLGTQGSLIAVGWINAVLAGALWYWNGPRRHRPLWRGLGIGVPVAILLVGWLLPPDRVVLAAGMFRGDRPQDLILFQEDAGASVTVRRLESRVGSFLSLELNGVNVAGSSPELSTVQQFQGHLPLLLADDARKVVHVGFGSGGTVHAVSLHPTVREIFVVEISPAVLSASDRFFSDINLGVLGDPRVTVELNDGRNFMLASPRTFDVVLSDAIHPRYSGNGSLYSREYFHLLRKKLKPGGAVAVGLPTVALTSRNYKMIVKAFTEVFPSTTLWYEPSAPNPFTLLTGRLDGKAWDAEALRRNFQTPEVAEALAKLGIRGPAEVLGCYLIGGQALRQWLEGVPPHRDDLPAVEYESGALPERQDPWPETFGELLDLRPATPPAQYLIHLSEAEQLRARRLWDTYTRAMEDHREFWQRLAAQGARR